MLWKVCFKRTYLNGESNLAFRPTEQGEHYKNAKIQAIEFITAHNLDFIDGNIVKYAVRRKKGESDVERYKKIKHYAELALELKK